MVDFKFVVKTFQNDLHGGFIVTRKWTKQSLKHFMNWSFYMATITTSKMLAN